MSDPLFGAGFFVGILGNLLARHIDPAARSAAEAIFARLTRRQPDLPPNHDVERVCRTSLRQSLELMAQSMDLHIAQPKTLVEAFKNRFDADGRWKPMIDWWHTDEKDWFVRFTENIASDRSLADFDLGWIQGASSLNDPLRSLKNPELEQHFSKALVKWVERHVTVGKPPAFFAEWVRDGWPIAQDSPHVRIALFPAWCLFLQQHFKQNENVKAILTADWLASIDARLQQIPMSAEQWTAALREPLGEQLRMLIELRDQVQQLAASHAGLEERTGQLFALVLAFRGEVGAGFSQVRAILETQHKEVVRKLDTSLSNDRQILAKLNHLIAAEHRVHRESTATDRAAPSEKRIADSKLLASDGAARFTRLVGRAQEKALLTRAWNDDGCRVLSFVAWGGTGKTSLIVDWLVKSFFERDWEGVDAFFDWSFYSQGTRDQSSASSDAFFSAALRHFGEDQMAGSNAAPEEKASRLAAAMAKQRTLLILDGLEPLQHPRKPGQEEGRLKDNGMATLLRLLAQSRSPGLCIITTRVPVMDLRRFHDSTVHEVPLNHLSVRHGAELLHLAGARFAGAASIAPDDQELIAAVKAVKGHAMTLQMLGGYLGSVQKGDIRRRDRVDFGKVFDDQLEGHTYNVMAAYEEWFKAEGPRGRRQLAVLRMLGLFDRVADAGCIQALRRDGGIAGVSDEVAALSEDDWQATLSHLSEKKLVFVDRDTQALDAHPLLREFFAQSLQEGQPEAWRAAHGRIYTHLRDTAPGSTRFDARDAMLAQYGTPSAKQPTLEDLKPLYDAVTHGCHAGLHQEVCDDVYYMRIQRMSEAYSVRVLGAIGLDLAAVTCFFEVPWSRISQLVTEDAQPWLLNQAASWLRSLGRLTESLEPMRLSGEMDVRDKQWLGAAISYINLCETEQALGEVSAAYVDAEQAVIYADRSGDTLWKVASHCKVADTLQQAGRRDEAEARFRQAEQMQELQTYNSLLYSLRGFRYCELLLSASERYAWQAILQIGSQNSDLGALTAVAHRASKTLQIAVNNRWLLDASLDRITLGCTALYSAMLAASEAEMRESQREIARCNLDLAVTGLRQAGQLVMLPCSLLSRAWLRFLDGQRTGPDGAQEDLDEAWEIAERGPMRLFMADILLYRARLFFREKEYPWKDAPDRSGNRNGNRSAKDDLADAEYWINRCGYHRRDEELADAKLAILGSAG